MSEAHARSILMVELIPTFRRDDLSMRPLTLSEDASLFQFHSTSNGLIKPFSQESLGACFVLFVKDKLPRPFAFCCLALAVVVFAQTDSYVLSMPHVGATAVTFQNIDVKPQLSPGKMVELNGIEPSTS